jgi:hypothetical protein
MKRSSSVGRVLGTAIGTALLAGSVTLPAFASLGGDASSVVADAAQMKGQAQAIASGGYTVNAITLPSGTVLNEYVSSEGVVFAVTWKGLSVPNLQQALGTYYETFKAAASAPHTSHKHLSVQTPEVVVHTGGHMRAHYGKAYVPALLPPNFSPQDIK